MTFKLVYRKVKSINIRPRNPGKQFHVFCILRPYGTHFEKIRMHSTCFTSHAVERCWQWWHKYLSRQNRKTGWPQLGKCWNSYFIIAAERLHIVAMIKFVMSLAAVLDWSMAGHGVMLIWFRYGIVREKVDQMLHLGKGGPNASSRRDELKVDFIRPCTLPWRHHLFVQGHKFLCSNFSQPFCYWTGLVYGGRSDRNE